MLDSSMNDVKGIIYTASDCAEPNLPNASLAFWHDELNDRVYIILDIGGTQFKTEMMLIGGSESFG